MEWTTSIFSANNLQNKKIIQAKLVKMVISLFNSKKRCENDYIYYTVMQMWFYFLWFCFFRGYSLLHSSNNGYENCINFVEVYRNGRNSIKNIDFEYQTETQTKLVITILI